jgi:hypothetical protein
MKRTAFALFVLFALSLFGGGVARAYEPTVGEIIARFLQNKSATTRVIVESKSVVFDPFAERLATADAAGQVDAVLIPGVGEDEELLTELPEREFVQVTYWMRDLFLAVETFSSGGELLHFYMKEGFEPVSFSLVPERPFSEWDVVSPYVPFLEGEEVAWRAGLHRWGVQPETVQLLRTAKGEVHFRLVESPGKAVWVDRARYVPLKIDTLLEGGKKPLAMSIEFQEFLLFGDEEEGLLIFPRTTNFLLDGRLFKQTTVRRFENEPSWNRFPLTRLRRKAAELREAAAKKASLQEVAR